MRWASSSGCPTRCSRRWAASYERWDGRGWPGELEGADVPIASRVAQLAEFVEVAHRVGGVEAAKALARKRAGGQFDPALAELVCAEAEMILAGLDAIGTWDAVIDAEPALAVVLSAERFDAALLAIATFVDLKSPYFLGHARAVADLAAAAGARLGLPEGEVRALRRAGSSTTSAGSGCRTRSGTSAGRSAPASGSACASIPT